MFPSMNAACLSDKTTGTQNSPTIKLKKSETFTNFKI